MNNTTAVEGLTFLFKINENREVEEIAVEQKADYKFSSQLVSTLIHLLIKNYIDNIPEENRQDFLVEVFTNLRGENNNG